MKVNKPILIALVVTIVVCGYVFFFTGKKKVVTNAPVVPPVDVASLMAQVKQKSAVRPRPPMPKLDVAWSSDPFELPAAFERDRSEAARLPMKVVAILSGKDGRVAVIGNEVVKKGDFIEGEKVVDITQHSVVLARGGARRVINLDEQPGKDVAIKVQTQR